MRDQVLSGFRIKIPERVSEKINMANLDMRIAKALYEGNIQTINQYDHCMRESIFRESFLQ